MAIFGGLSLTAKSRFPETETAEGRDSVRMRRLLRRKAEHLVLARPFSRRIGEASNSHSMRELARDSCFDEIGREEGKRDRHIHLADAAALTLRNGFRGCRRIRGKLGEPTTSPDNRRDQCGARFRPDRTDVSWRPLRQENFAAPFSDRLLPRNLQSALGIGSFCSGKFDNQLLPLNLDARDMTAYQGPVVHWL